MVTTLQYLSLFFAGILAGIEVAVHYGLVKSVELLSEKAQIQLRKGLVLRLRVLVPAFFIPTALLAITVAVLEAATAGAWINYAALFALLIWVMIRVVRTVPVNSATLAWNPDAPPTDWRAQIDRVERFHVIGVCAAVAAFVLLLTSLALRSAP